MRRVVLYGTLALLALAPALAAAAQDQVPRDTVRVAVTLEGKPVSGQSVKVIGVPPGGGEVGYGTATTDGSGIATFHIPFKVGLALTAYTVFQGVHYKSPAMSYAGSPQVGLRLNLTVFAKSTGGATLKDIRFGPQSHLVAELGDDYLSITEVLSVQNGSEDTFDPKGGLVIPLPKGFYDVNGVNAKPIYTDPGVGARAPGPFMPGSTQVVVTFKVPHHGHRMHYDQPLAVPMGNTEAIIEDAKGLKVSGKAVSGESITHDEGRQLRVVGLDTSSRHIRFDLEGLPYRTNRSRWIAAGFAGAVVLFGLVMLIGGGEQRTQDKQLRESLEAQRDELLADLAQLERDRQDGTVDDDDYREDRQEILDHLANVLRGLER